MKIRWVSDAMTDIDHIHDYIAAGNPNAAKQVRERLVHVGWRLADFPHSAREGNIPGTRELVVPGLPYIIVYRISDPYVDILRVFHTAQDTDRY